MSMGVRMKRSGAYPTGSGLPLHYTRWTRNMKRKGIKRDAAFLVRPDGHIGVAATTGNIRPIEEYVERFNLKMR